MIDTARRPSSRIWRPFIAALLLLAAWTGHAQSEQPKASRPDKTALSPQTSSLAPFFKALGDLDSGQGKRPVILLQIGDSHTATGYFTERLRSRFQDRFGSAGQGLMPPGIPYKYYRPPQAVVKQSAHWTVKNSFKTQSAYLFGVTGYRVAADQAGATMSLTTEDPAGFDLAEIEVLEQPDGGALLISVDNRPPREESVRNKVVQIRRISLQTPPGSRQLGIRLKGDGPVELLAWTFQRNKPGVILESQGIVGATVNIVDLWDPNILAWELTHRRPALVIVEFGGNEGFNDKLDAAEYEKSFRDRINQLQKSAPGSSILIVGPADAARLPNYCLNLKETSPDRPVPPVKKSAANREAAPEKRFSCAPLTQLELRNYKQMQDAKDPLLCRWHAPPNLSVVREIQRSVAKEKSLPFWDWSVLMDRDCGIHDWVLRNPQLATPDHVHLQKEGYFLSADALFKSLMEQYELFRPTPPKTR